MSKTEVLYVRCTPETKRKIKMLMLELDAKNLEETLNLLAWLYERHKEEVEAERTVKFG